MLSRAVPGLARLGFARNAQRREGSARGEPTSQTSRWDADQPDSLCDWASRQRHLPWESLSVVVVLVLWISYGLLFVGELTAWWIPYLFHAEPERAVRYQLMFGATHTFLPQRNGIRVNTLHVILHLATLTTLIVLGVLTA